MDSSLPGSPIHGIFQVRIMEWASISFSRRSSQPRDRTRVSCIADRRFTIWATREALYPNTLIPRVQDGEHVYTYLWRIHVDIWQNQYNIVKLKNKIKFKKRERDTQLLPLHHHTPTHNNDSHSCQLIIHMHNHKKHLV